MNKLMIVESPNKIKKITGYLSKVDPNSKWTVAATVGHFTELAKKGEREWGVKDFIDFDPIFQISSDKKPTFKKLQELASKVDEVYLAADPDREGEAIAEQTKVWLKLKDYKRVTFSEISEAGISKALKNVGKIDQDLVEAAYARRVLDRLFGFELSQKYMRLNSSMRSVGRVQTPALRIVVDRENEILNFKPNKYIGIKAIASKIDDAEFKVKAFKGKEIKLNEMNIDETKTIADKASTIKDVTVVTVKKENKRNNPGNPPSTNDVLSMAINKLNMDATSAGKVLQWMFDNGYTTYPRTDGAYYDPSWTPSAREWVSNNLDVTTSDEDVKVGKTSKNAQEAHEAIRPTDISVIAIDDSSAPRGAAELYKLIHTRAVRVLIGSGSDNKLSVVAEANEITFTSSFSIPDTLGWRQYKTDYSLGGELPDIEEGSSIDVTIETKEKATKPPSRFTEASLLKQFEKESIGRPSTYVSIIATIKGRQYVNLVKKNLVPTEVGTSLIAESVKLMPELVDLGYTAKLEEELDLISTGKSTKKALLSEFWKKLASIVVEMDKDPRIVVEYAECLECGFDKAYWRDGKFGKFIACPKWKTHKKKVKK